MQVDSAFEINNFKLLIKTQNLLQAPIHLKYV